MGEFMVFSFKGMISLLILLMCSRLTHAGVFKEDPWGLNDYYVSQSRISEDETKTNYSKIYQDYQKANQGFEPLHSSWQRIQDLYYVSTGPDSKESVQQRFQRSLNRLQALREYREAARNNSGR